MTTATTIREKRAPGSLHRSLAAIYETDFSGKRTLAMEGLRGMAIALVFFCHYKMVVLSRLSPTFDSTFFRTTVQMGATGVDLFFLLSGMLIYRAALRSDLHIGRFLSRRIRRIYPTFLVVLAIYLVASVVLHQGEQRVPAMPGEAVQYLTWNVLLLPGMLDMKPLIPATWSLSYELCFYIAIPIIVFTLRLSRWSRKQRCVLWCSLLCLHILYVLALPKTLPAYRYQDNNFLRFGMFFGGMLVFEVLSSHRGSRWLTTSRQTLLSVIGIVAGSGYFWFVLHTVNVEKPPIFHFVTKAVLIFIAYTSLALATLVDNGIWKRIFSNDWLRWMGNISYSLYLIHGILLNGIVVVALHLGIVRAHPYIASVALFPVCVVATAAVSTLLFLAVEKPLSLQPPRSERVAAMQRSSTAA